MKHDMASYIKRNQGKYLMVAALGRRVRALQTGSRALVRVREGDIVATALEEMRQGFIDVATQSDDSPVSGGESI